MSPRQILKQSRRTILGAHAARGRNLKNAIACWESLDSKLSQLDAGGESSKAKREELILDAMKQEATHREMKAASSAAKLAQEEAERAAEEEAERQAEKERLSGLSASELTVAQYREALKEGPFVTTHFFDRFGRPFSTRTDGPTSYLTYRCKDGIVSLKCWIDIEHYEGVRIFEFNQLH